MADHRRVRERAFSLLSSTVAVLHQSPLSNTRQPRRVIKQCDAVHSISRSRRRFVAHLILLVVAVLFWRQAVFLPTTRHHIEPQTQEGNNNKHAYTSL